MTLVSDWYPLILLESLSLKDFDKLNNAKIAEMFILPLTAIDVNNAMQRLEKLGLVAKNSRGRYQRVENVTLFTDMKTPSEVIQKYHLQGMELAKSALARNSLDERFFTGVTFPSSKAAMIKLRNLINALNEEALDLTEVENADAVYRVNVQAFKVTKT